MAKIRLDLSQFKASGIYTVEFDASESIVLNTQTTRLVVGFSKKGPINAPVYCPDVKTARRIFGNIDKDLENKGSFFHRSLFTCLETGPCFALALLKLDDDSTSPTVDKDTYKSFSLSTTEANGVSEAVLYSSFFNKERFYFPDTSYFLANVGNNATNAGKLLNFVNLGQAPFSIFVTKTGELNGFNVTARDWFGSGNVPHFVREFDYISDYFINIDVVAGDWTNFNTLSSDPNFAQYFNEKGLIKTKMTAFLSSPYVTRLGSFQGCVIPDLVDNNGVNYSIDTIVNAGLATTGLFCALDREALADYDNTDTMAKGRIDMIGHTLIDGNESGVIDFLSYNFISSEFKDLLKTDNFSKIEFNLGTSGVAPYLPTGAGYDPVTDGYNFNDPTRAAWFESFYGQGNDGKFNNLLVLRKAAFSTNQYSQLANLTAGSSILSPDGSNYAKVSTVNTGLRGSDEILILGISHPLKSLEGTTSGKNALVLNKTSSDITVAGLGASNDLNIGDWIFAEKLGVRYYFRVDGVDDDGTDSTITIDTTDNFDGATSIQEIDSFFKVYWESTQGASGSLFDVIDIANASGELNVVAAPDKFTYTSVSGGQSYYTGYESSAAYQLFNTGILANSDKLYMATNGGAPLYLSASFGNDTDAVSVLNLTAFRDEALTIAYTGSWSFANSRDDEAQQLTDKIRIYSLVGDYASTVAATNFNATRTKCYVNPADQAKIQVGQYLVADPIGNDNPPDFILTRVISKRAMPMSGPNAGNFEINVNQRLKNGSQITRYKAVQDVATNYQPTYLPGFKITSKHTPNNSDERLAEILSLLDPGVSNLSEALSSRHIISFRYIVDTFDGGLQTQSYPKNLISELALKRQKCLAIMNAPSMKKFIGSNDPRFTDPVTAANPKPLLNTRYIAEGGNLSLSPSFTYSLPDEEHGAKFSGFFAPFLTIRENNKNFNIPPAADVSNNFIRKFINGQPYSIVAGPRRGVLSNPRLVGLEYDFTDNDRGYLEPIGWNPIVFRRGIGFMIFGNQSAFQKTPSAFNNLHVRDLLITVEEAIEDILANYLYEFNDASLRLQIKSIVDAYLDNVRSGGGIYDFKTIMDESNNTPDIIDQNFAIIDVGIEPARGAQKFINRVTVFKTGGIASGGFTVA